MTQPTTVTGIRPGLAVRGLDRGQTPAAHWLCTCGEHEAATGADAVRALCEIARPGHCPHNPAAAKEAA